MNFLYTQTKQWIAARVDEAFEWLEPSTATYWLAAGLWAYVVLGWCWSFIPPAWLPKSAAAFYLIGSPVLFAAIVNFESTTTWARVGGLAWLPFFLLLRFLAWAIGGAVNLLERFWRPIINAVAKAWDWWRERSARRKQKAPKVKIEDASNDADKSSAKEASNSTDAQALAEDDGIRQVQQFFESIRPRVATQIAATTVWLLWIGLWCVPAFLELNTTWSVMRLIAGFFFPAFVLGTLMGIEFSYRPFPFWRTTIGMLWTPLYRWLHATFRIFFLRPDWLQWFLSKVWLLRKLYYPAALFFLFNRRYLTYLLLLAIASIVTLLMEQGYAITVALFCGLYIVEVARLVSQLKEIRYLGVADFNDLSEALNTEERTGKDKIEEGELFARAVQRYMMARLARKVLDQTAGEDSYFATVVSILLKHVTMIGVAVAVMRVFYELGFRQNQEMSTFDTFVNSFILLFGEVTFASSEGFLGIVNLLGVAASFLLLGLGLTYLSGTAHENYRKKAEKLRETIEAFEQGPEMDLAREGVLRERAERLAQLTDWDLVGIALRFNRASNT